MRFRCGIGGRYVGRSQSCGRLPCVIVAFAAAISTLSVPIESANPNGPPAGQKEFQHAPLSTSPQTWQQIDERYNAPPPIVTVGALQGEVTVDQGVVRALRVKAHDLDHGIYYTVYTNRGHYHFYSLPASTYEVFVLPYEAAYESPTERVELAAGATVSVNLALKATKRAADRIQHLSWDEIYPDEPGKTELMQNCITCHGRLWFHRVPRTREAWAYSVDRMTTGVPTWTGTANVHVTPAQRDLILEYLARNFTPDKPQRDVALDSRAALLDEGTLADAIWTEYEYPAAPSTNDADLTPAGRTPFGGFNVLHDAFVSPVDGTIWLSSPGTDSVVNLNPRTLSSRDRWRTYPMKQGGRLSWEHGITLDSHGHVWVAEITDGRLGELDPSTGIVVQHEPPHAGSILQVVADSDDNIWYGHVHGGFIGRFNAKTRSFQDWAMPIVDSSAYGMVIDHRGNFWAAGWGRNVVIRFDPKRFRFSEYFTTSVPSGVRRIGVDEKDNVWFTEYSAEGIGVIEHDSRQIKEYRTPLRWAQPYEAWPDGRGTVWVTDDVYGSIIAFDQRSRKWGAWYPLPQEDHWSVPKVEVDADGALWMGSRMVPNLVAVRLQPHGNVPVSFKTAVVNSPNTKHWSSGANSLSERGRPVSSQ